MPLLIPGLDAIGVAQGVTRLRQLCEEAGRDPATMPIHGRVYVGEPLTRQLEEAVELGFADLSVGFNRRLLPGRSQQEQLEAIVAVKAEVDASR